MKATEQKKHALLVSTKIDGSYGHIKANVVRLEEGKVRNPRHSWDNKTSEFYEDLWATCQMSQDHEGSYGWGVAYRDMYSVNITTAEKMVKTLKTIDRKYSALVNKIGEPTTYGGYVAYIASAIGAEQIIFYHENGQRSYYDDSEFKKMSVADGRREIDYLVSKIHAELTPEKRLRAV